jgi:hypothetical protein
MHSENFLTLDLDVAVDPRALLLAIEVLMLQLHALLYRDHAPTAPVLYSTCLASLRRGHDGKG